MSTVYLNRKFLPIEQASISPLDRGFLFGDGIYEFIPTYSGKAIGLNYHLERLELGLENIQINLGKVDWIGIISELLNKNKKGNIGVYIHVSRGADKKRTHNFPTNVNPTIFLMTQKIAPLVEADRTLAKGFAIVSSKDRRWDNCHIKSTSLLGNVLHFQHGFENNVDETLLYNDKNELTECSACNVFIVQGNQISTPILDHQILPGITRRLIINAIASDSRFCIKERIVTLEEAILADELWITSSTKQIAPVVTLDGQPIGCGKVGPVWEDCQSLYNNIRFN